MKSPKLKILHKGSTWHYLPMFIRVQVEAEGKLPTPGIGRTTIIRPQFANRDYNMTLQIHNKIKDEISKTTITST